VRGRIEDGFRRRFRDLLALVRPRRLEFGVELLMRRGRRRSEQDGVPLARGLLRVYAFTRERVERRLTVTGACSLVKPPWDRFKTGEPPRFLCDASLGGLARWLRAAGYAASWSPGEGGEALAPRAVAGGLVLLTSDSAVLDRGGVRDGTLTALWVPSGLSPREQLTLAMKDLGLSLRTPRCMACGGELVPARKEDVLPRIPPRTARWKDEYFLCAGCGRLFWQGTHWQRIERALREGLLDLAS
jgi:uncharacterized protein with PIN domain